MLIYYALNITSLKVTDTTKPRVRNSPIEKTLKKIPIPIKLKNSIQEL